MKIFLNFKQPQVLRYIWIQKLFQRLIWINYQNCKKKLFTYDIRNVELQQNPPIFTNICTFGFGFGIRPKARYFSGQIFGFGLKWKTYFRSFTGIDLDSELATNFCEISTVDLPYVVTIKSMVGISQNFVAFSEYMNFMNRKVQSCAK